MSGSLDLLDRALALGKEELTCLRAGEVDDCQALALERGSLINSAYEQATDSVRESLREKLLQLRDQQRQLSSEAKRLHADLRDNLKATKQQTIRFSGYARTVKPTPLASRFLNKQG